MDATVGVQGVHFTLNVFKVADSEKALQAVRTVLQGPDSPIAGLQEADFEVSPGFGAIMVRLPSPITQELWERIVEKIAEVGLVNPIKTSPPAIIDYRRENMDTEDLAKAKKER
jgi:hypothetical protein